MRNNGSVALTGARVHLNVPAVDAMPSLAAVESIPASGESVVRIVMGPVDRDALPSSGTVPAFAYVTADRGQEGFTAALPFSAQLAVEPRADDSAEALACRAVPQDTLAGSLPGFLLSGAVPDPPQPLADFAGILDVLGIERQAAGGEPLPGTGMRGMLRGVTGSEAQWTVVMASIASSLGLPAAILTTAGRPLAVVDTRIPFFSALSAVPELQRHRETLARLSPAGTLWVPLSGRIPPPAAMPPRGLSATRWSCWPQTAARERCGRCLPASPDSGTTDSRNTASPFPLVLPAFIERPSLGALRGADRCGRRRRHPSLTASLDAGFFFHETRSMAWSTVYLVIAIIAAIIGIWNLARQRSIFLSLSGILWFLVVLFRWIVPMEKVYDYRIAEGLPAVGDLVALRRDPDIPDSRFFHDVLVAQVVTFRVSPGPSEPRRGPCRCRTRRCFWTCARMDVSPRLPAAMSALHSRASPSIHDIPRAVPRKRFFRRSASSDRYARRETLGPISPTAGAAISFSPVLRGQAAWQSWHP